MVIIKTGFTKYNADGLCGKAQTIIDTMTDAIADYAIPDPTLATVQTAKDALTAAQSIRKNIVDGYTVRDNRKDELIVLLNNLALYTKQTCQEDLAMAMRSGFDIRQSSNPVGELPEPVDFRLRVGINPGEMKMSMQSMGSKASSYVFRFSQTEGTDPETWEGVVTTKSHVLISGLTSGKKVFAQGAGVGSNLHLVWSAVITMYVV